MSKKYEKPCAILTFSIWLWFRSAQEWSPNGRHMQHTNQSKNQNCWYFVRPTQKNDSPKIEPKACIVTTWAPWSINKAKNVDISLDQIKKTILQKVCTLTILGLVWWYNLCQIWFSASHCSHSTPSGRVAAGGQAGPCRKSAEISGNQRKSAEISGNQRKPAETSGNQRKPAGGSRRQGRNPLQC